MNYTRQFLLFMLIFWNIASGARPAWALRPWTIKDTVELSTAINWDRSPDHRYQAVVTTQGRLQDNQIESKLWIYDAVNFKNFIDGDANQYKPEGQLVAVKSVEPTGEWVDCDVITDVRWSYDSKTIYYLARCGKNCERRLFSANFSTRLSKQVSQDGQDVTVFAIGKDTCVYMSKALIDRGELFQSAGDKTPDIVFGSGKSILDLLYPNRPKYDFEVGPQDLWIVHDDKVRSCLDADTKAPLKPTSDHPGLSVSPDGKYIIVAQRVATVPPAWEKYRPCYEYRFKNFVAGDYGPKGIKSLRVPERYLIVEVDSGKITTLVDAPLCISAGYYDWAGIRWSPNGQKIALSGIYYPLDKIIKVPHLMPCVIVVDLPDKAVKFVSERPVERDSGLNRLDWAGDDESLQIAYFSKTPELYKYTKGAWKKAEPNAGPGKTVGKDVQDMIFGARESLNHPSVMTLKDTTTNREKTFLDPNPQIAEIDMTNASLLTWKAKSGREITGGLVKPFDYKPGKRYPLVIQAYGFHPDRFFADGYYRSAFPGRALAAKGICVLQLDDVRHGKSMKPEGAEDAREAYLSAIEHLDKEGLIDPSRVGITGFSHSGFYVLNTLTNAPDAIRAAVLAECTTVSFGEYLNGVDWGTPDFNKDTAGMVGTAPFGKGLEKWVADSPGFNTDKIQAAVMCQYYSPVNLAFSWNIYPALRAQGKAAEILYIRGGTHELTQPRQRFISQETTADWFDFWLNDHEDPDPAKIKQYERWRAMPKAHSVVQPRSASDIKN